MERISERIKSNSHFLAASVVYAAAVFLLFPYLRYFVDNPDTVSYITIARKYFLHDYSNAVNGYWSPLISWMLALLYNLSQDEVYLFKLLQIPIGLFALYNFEKLIRAFIHPGGIRVVLVFSGIPLILSYALLNLTPDLLFLSIVLFYLRIVSEKEFFNHRHFGLIAGVLGILLYFSKSFGFYFFLAHFTVLTLKVYFQTKEHAFRKFIIGNYAQAIICFATVSSIWIYLISHKYGHLTISENAVFNLSREVAAGPEEGNTLPVLSDGITMFKNPTAVNAWEDPGLSTRVTPLRPVSIAADFEIYKKVLERNILTIYYFDFRRQSGLVFVFLLIVFLFSKKRKRIITDDYFFSLLFALIIIYGGYSLILVHTRYIWVCTLIMLLLSAWMFEEILAKIRAFHVLIRIVFMFVLGGLVLKRPVKEILFTADKDMSANTLFNSMLHPLETIRKTYSNDRIFFNTRSKVVPMITPGSNIISIKDNNGERDVYTRASLIALASDAKYLGSIPADAEILQQNIRNVKIDYLLNFSEKDIQVNPVYWQNEYNNEKLPLKIYRRKY